MKSTGAGDSIANRSARSLGRGLLLVSMAVAGLASCKQAANVARGMEPEIAAAGKRMPHPAKPVTPKPPEPNVSSSHAEANAETEAYSERASQAAEAGCLGVSGKEAYDKSNYSESLSGGEPEDTAEKIQKGAKVVCDAWDAAKR